MPYFETTKNGTDDVYYHHLAKERGDIGASLSSSMKYCDTPKSAILA